jgi:formylmethanofuran dehydrogenase subunit E
MYEQYPRDFQQVIDFHGHACPGLAIGYRVARAAMERLEARRPRDEELVAIVETDACGVDAVQHLLGCTLGKGNLIYRDHGKQVFTVVDRERDRAVRIALKPSERPGNEESRELARRLSDGVASEEEKQRFSAIKEQRIEDILEADAETLFKIEDVPAKTPGRARIFPSLVCEFCGESVMEPRARLRDGKTACIPCAASYSHRE